jgi:hypothetical protein
MTRHPEAGRGGGGLSLSEKLFALFIAGTLAAVFVSFAFQPQKGGAKGRAGDAAERAKLLRYLSMPVGSAAAGASGAPLGARRAAAAGGEAEGLIVARADPEELEARHGAPRASGAGRVQAGAPREADDAEQPADEPVARSSSAAPPQDAATPAAGAPAAYVSRGPSPESRSLFVPSRLGLALHVKRLDIWAEWADVHLRNIAGARGADALTAAFELVAASRAGALVDDLLRKGIPLAFGDPSAFSGGTAHAVATFDFSPADSPAQGAPSALPAIRFNPAFLGEDPRVLAAALVHEATHFQQFLDGSLLDDAASRVELELEAWWNEAAFWDETRAAGAPGMSILEEQAELAYRTALRGEAALRDLITAIHG